jgi:dipeptidyl aminopeptidase/acylaminoacyl peptidase
MTLAALWSAIPQPEPPMLSGDGRHAFWPMTGPTPNAEIWTAPTDGSAPARAVTRASPDHLSLRGVDRSGTRLILATSRNADEHDQLLLCDTATGTLTALTPEQHSHYLYGGAFSPDDQTIAFLADHDLSTNQPAPGAILWTLHLPTARLTALLRTTDPFDIPPQWSPDGTRLLLHRNRLAPGGVQLWTVTLDGQADEVLNLGPATRIHAVWRDDQTLAVIADGATNDRLGLLDLATGTPRWLAENENFNPQSLVPHDDGTVAVIAYADSQLSPYLLTGDTLTPLKNPTGRSSLLPHAGIPGAGWLAEVYDASAPHALVHLHPDGTATPLWQPAPDPALHFARPESIHWTAPDGLTVQGWLHHPDGPSRGLVVHVHGGPTWHSEDWVNPKIAHLRQSGFTVVEPNYRGSTGFGRTYREMIKDDGWGGREQADIRAGIEHLIASGIAQPGKIAVTGNSYGGFSSWFAITRHADLVTAAIPMCGMYRLDIDYAATEMPHGRAYSEEMMGGPPEAFPDRYANASPGNFIDAIRGDLLIVHGLADSNVGPENTHAAIRELTAKGIPHEVMLFPDEGHGIARRDNLARYLATAEAFITRAFAAGPRP